MAEPSYEILTRHLRLYALSLAQARLALNGDRAALGAQISTHVPPEWPGHELAESLPTIIAEMERLAHDERWLWVIVDQATSTVIGDIGFHGPVTGAPTVELGYVILPGSQGHGYATEASEALLDWAAGRPAVERVIARIAHGNTASLRVAAKLHMREVVSVEPRYRRYEWRTRDHRRP
ncbi:MAG TPA: GNAT family N-acetyltransferase [Ktedonobacterales bacterium]